MANRASSDADEPAIDPALPEKKRARRRLVGAAVVGLAAIIGLTLILDAEPRRPGTDVAVQIPSRDTPLTPSSTPPARTDAPADPKAAPKVEPKAEQKAEPKPEPKAEARPDAARPDPKAADVKPSSEPKPAARSEKADPKAARADTKADAKGDAKADPKNDPKGDAKARAADARKTDKTAKAERTDAAAAGQRFFLQIGAYGNDKSARQQVDRAREAGVRAYTERIKTKDGERVRVRVGPFSSRDAAEQARAKLKLVGMDSAVVAL